MINKIQTPFVDSKKSLAVHIRFMPTTDGTYLFRFSFVLLVINEACAFILQFVHGRFIYGQTSLTVKMNEHNIMMVHLDVQG